MKSGIESTGVHDPGILDSLRHSRFGAVLAAGISTVGFALALPDTANSSKPLAEISGGNREKGMATRPVRAFATNYATGHTMPKGSPHAFGGRRQYINSYVGIDGFSQEYIQDWINQDTKRCQDETVKTSIGRQILRYNLGGKELTVTNKLYDAEAFSQPRVNFAKWEYDCEDVISISYSLQAVIKQRKKVVNFGKPVVLENNDGTLFDGYVRESKLKRTKLTLHHRISAKDKNRHVLGYKTTVMTRVLPPYEGQAVASTNKPRNKSWIHWLGSGAK